ncbi:hypothetical protein D3C72_2041590 [compost metagenome]
MVLKVSCPSQLADLSIPVKFADIKWSFAESKTELDDLHGQVQADSSGQAKIHFRTKESVAKQKFKVSIKSTTKEFSLNIGPYEVLLNNKDCGKQ